MNLKGVQLPKRYNYIACFLTLHCNLNCAYCINWLNPEIKSKKILIPGKRWIEGLNRLVCPTDLPVTIQGGEPGLHPDFIQIIKNIKKDLNIDILTNLSFNVDEFIDNIDPARLHRSAPYPNIRVSYHPFYMDLKKLIKKVLKMQKAGFSIGIFMINHPKLKQEALGLKRICKDFGVDFRVKEFLGYFNGRLYGTYRYPRAVGKIRVEKCLCRTSELIIGPNASIFRCHRDLYRNFYPIGNLTDPGLKVKDIFRKCNYFGECNPCDIKIKTNRFQVYNHTSVQIKDIIQTKP